MKDKSVVDRLEKVMNEKQIKKADLARAAGITPQAVGRWFKSGSISIDSLKACAHKFNVSLEWLLNGDTNVSVTEAVESSAEYLGKTTTEGKQLKLENDDVAVPFFVEVEHEQEPVVKLETVGPRLRFSKSTLKMQGIDVEHVACVKVSGNSMEPVIPDGSTVGIDTSNTAIKDGDMYAIDWAGSLFVKILNRRPGGQLRIRSFNFDKYPDENLSNEEAKSITVLGRVFWYSVLV